MNLKAGNLQEALDEYNKALKLSQNPDIYAKIGQILSMQQNYTEATEYFSKAYTISEKEKASKVLSFKTTSSTEDDEPFVD